MVLSELAFDVLSNEFDLSKFDCGDADINAFLMDDALNFQIEKLATTYLFHIDHKPIAYFSILNDCLHDKGYEANTWNRFHRKHKIPNNKRIRQYPAVKIGIITKSWGGIAN